MSDQILSVNPENLTLHLIGVSVELFSDDDEKKGLCLRYWDRNGETWTHKVAEIAEKLNIHKNRVAAFTREWCRAYPNQQRCRICGGYTTILNSRSEFDYSSTVDICDP